MEIKGEKQRNRLAETKKRKRREREMGGGGGGGGREMAETSNPDLLHQDGSPVYVDQRCQNADCGGPGTGR